MTDLTKLTIRRLLSTINGRNCGPTSNWSQLCDLLDEPETSYGTLADWVILIHGEESIIRVSERIEERCEVEYAEEARRILDIKPYEWDELASMPVERAKERLSELLVRWDEPIKEESC